MTSAACRSLLARGLTVLCLLGATFALPAQDRVVLSGSNTVGEKLARELARAWLQSEGYAQIQHTDLALDEYRLIGTRADGRTLSVEVAAHGTSTGYGQLVQGRADIWMASRPVNANEVAAARAVGKLDEPAQEHVIALDGLSVIVHPNNPVRALDLKRIRDVFTGRIRDWAQLGGRPGPIAVHARNSESGTFDTFKALVLGSEAIRADALRYESSDQLSRAVAADPQAIGFVGLAAVGDAAPLAVSDAGSNPLGPTRAAVATEDYVLSRRLFFYTRKDPPAAVARFINFALGAGGQATVDRVGFVALEVAPLGPVDVSRLPDPYREATSGAERLAINFRFGSGLALLDSRGERDLERLVRLMKRPENATRRIRLVGFTDENERLPIIAMILSTDRADNIATLLIARGIRVERVRGLGDLLPVASNESELGRAKNRRVEVWLN